MQLSLVLRSVQRRDRGSHAACVEPPRARSGAGGARDRSGRGSLLGYEFGAEAVTVLAVAGELTL